MDVKSRVDRMELKETPSQLTLTSNLRHLNFLGKESSSMQHGKLPFIGSSTMPPAHGRRGVSQETGNRSLRDGLCYTLAVGPKSAVNQRFPHLDPSKLMPVKSFIALSDRGIYIVPFMGTPSFYKSPL